MKEVDSNGLESNASGEVSVALEKERRVNYFAALFGCIMMLLALVAPFIYAERELQFGLTVLQVFVWFSFCAAWIYQGYLAQKQGLGFDSEGASKANRKSINLQEAAMYLLVFGPLCFAFFYVSYLNTGYFGFNYVMMFIVAGFSSLIFPLGIACIYLLYQTLLWVLVAHWMWGGWMDLDAILTALSGFLFSSMMFYMYRRERESRGRALALSQKLDAANQQLRVFSRKVEELAATQERNRIAREIHDTLGHSLTVVNMQIQTAKALIKNDSEKAETFLQKAQEVTKKGLTDIRSSVASLRASPLDGKSLRDAMQELLETSFTNGTRTELDLKGDLEGLRPAVESALYRSAQEALTNVRKHAEASEVRVGLDATQPEAIELVVADNGKGCASVNGGFGIMGMRERIQLLDGSFEVSSSLGAGMRITVSVPK